jgi:hypothetical protein
MVESQFRFSYAHSLCDALLNHSLNPRTGKLPPQWDRCADFAHPTLAGACSVRSMPQPARGEANSGWKVLESNDVRPPRKGHSILRDLLLSAPVQGGGPLPRPFPIRYMPQAGIAANVCGFVVQAT